MDIATIEKLAKVTPVKGYYGSYSWRDEWNVVWYEICKLIAHQIYCNNAVEYYR